MTSESRPYSLDPVTFEVLKNAFANTVDQMAEQILRTCHSFVIYARDFSSSLCDVEGNTIMQGSQDIAVHVGTLHYTAKAVIEAFAGDIHPEDVFAINDPYLGGTHFNDVRIIRPIFVDGEVIAYAQSNGHWADVGGTVPGSFDINAKEHFGEGLRIPPIRIWDQGKYLGDIVRMLASNTRAPDMVIGDLQAQAEATRVCEREILRLVEKYGKDTIMTAFREVQDYVEILTRRRVAEMPDGVWETEDYMDYDPSVGEGLIPIKVKMTIAGDQLKYDLSGSHPAVGTFLNAGFGSAFSGVIAGTKTFFPDVPLNSGFYRAVEVDLGPVGSVVNAPWPIAVTGFCAGPYEKIMNSIFELWSKLMPERALACSFNLEYLLVGGRDARSEDKPYFMWYDWMVGGWGGRNGRDGSNCTAPIFGVGLAVQPLEGQERLSPVVTTQHTIRTDSGGPGKYRGGCGGREGCDADRRRAHGHVLLLRQGALDRLGDRGWAALAAARRLAQSGHRQGALPGCGLLERADRTGRHVHAPVRGRRRLRRPARAGPRTRVRGRRRRLRLDRARTQGLRRRRPRGGRRPRRVRGRPQGNRLCAGTDRRRASRLAGRECRECGEALPRRRSRRTRSRPPLRRHPRLGHRRAPTEDHSHVPGDGAAAQRLALGGRGRLARQPMNRDRDLRWAEHPVVIVVAPTGAEVTREHNPAVPYTPQEIAADVVACRTAGAAVAHLHVREADGTPSASAELFKETIDLIRAACDIVTMVSTGGAMGMTIEERSTGLEAQPDMSGIETGSLNFGRDLFPTLPHETEGIAARAAELGISLEIEAFEIGHIDAALDFQRRGVFPSPLRINIVVGCPGALAATSHNLISGVAALPEDATWCVTAIGRHQTRMLTLALLLGATCVRVGFEDNVYLRRGELAGSNAALVEQIAAIARGLGREVATVEQARELLSLPHMTGVNR